MSLLGLAANIGSGGTLTYIKIGLIVTVIAIIGYFYMDYRVTKADLKTAIQVQQELKDTVGAQKLEITKTNEAVQQQQVINNDIASKNVQLDANLNKMQGAMSVLINGQKVDLKQAATQQPVIVEQKLNQGTKNSLRCNELATGATLLPEDATNPLCPELVKATVPNVKK